MPKQTGHDDILTISFSSPSAFRHNQLFRKVFRKKAKTLFLSILREYVTQQSEYVTQQSMACQEVSCSLLPRPLGLPVSRNAVTDRDTTQRIMCVNYRTECISNSPRKPPYEILFCTIDYIIYRVKFNIVSLLEIVYILVSSSFFI